MSDEEEQVGIPEWVVTFGDMMSLLLTFFIMLVSLSEIKEEEQFQAMVDSFRRQFGHDASMASLIPGPSKPRNSKIAKLATAGRARRFDTHRGGDKVSAPVGDYPRVQAVRPGPRATTGTTVFFEEGSERLDDTGRANLRIQVHKLGGKPQRIEIRGHTSRRPISNDSDYSDHWDLAFRRCHKVMALLVEFGIDPQRLRLSVAGPNEPLHVGTQAGQQQQNPRVEVFMLEEVVNDLQGTREQRDSRYLTPDSGQPATDPQPAPEDS